MNTRFNAYSVVNFTMRAKTTASVLCSEQLQLTPDSYCFFFNLKYVLISGITFVGCNVNMNSGDYVVFERSSFINKNTDIRCKINACKPGVLCYYGFVNTLVIKQCTFANNKNGNGGIYGYCDSLLVEGSTFENNDIGGNSGAAINHVGRLQILNSSFIGNVAGTGQAGGAVYSVSTFNGVKIANSYFNGNVAGGHSGAIYLKVIRGSGSRGQVNITNSYFNGNAVRSGSSYGTAGALTVNSDTGELVVTDSHFSDNEVQSSNASSPSGAAIFVESAGAGVAITNSYFRGNVIGLAAVSTSGYGGAVYIPDGHAGVNITNSYFTDNVVASSGGRGGAVAIKGGKVTIVNTMFISNRASDGGGGAIYCGQSYTNISLTKNTFSHNTAAYCGVMDVDEFYHYNTTFTGNTFTYNRAVGQVAGNNGRRGHLY